MTVFQLLHPWKQSQHGKGIQHEMMALTTTTANRKENTSNQLTLQILNLLHAYHFIEIPIGSQ